MLKPTSLSQRLFRTILAIVAVNVAVILLAAEFIYEDVENTVLRLEIEQERAFVETLITPPDVLTHRTALLHALFVPDAQRDTVVLPEPFIDRDPPFFQEIDEGEQAHLISVERVAEPPGTLYMARDITTLEQREHTTQIAMMLLGACALALGLFLARLGTRRVVAPLQRLRQQIAHVEPQRSLTRIDTGYKDAELAEIAAALNELLGSLQSYVRRERSLVSLASHELRTPITVIAGALDVMEQRDTLASADRRTLSRIRRATEDMQRDVQALLQLARAAAPERRQDAVDLPACTETVINELHITRADAKTRIHTHVTGTPARVRSEPALMQMLLRNLLQNALRHTDGPVRVELSAEQLLIADAGKGLPAEVTEQMATEALDPPTHGLGLYIVRLICERQHWSLQIMRGRESGTLIRIRFPRTPEAL